MGMPREYFYEVDAEGRLWHEGSPLDDPRFLDGFFRRLRPNDTGSWPSHPWVSICAGERNYVRCAIAPVVFRRLEGDALIYAGSLRQPFDPRALGVDRDGRLWHPAPRVGRGLLGRRVLHHIADRLHERGGRIVFATPQGEIPLGEADR